MAKTKYLKSYISALDHQVVWLLLRAIVLGVFAGLLEYGFAFVLQLFLHAIGILPVMSFRMPEWFPNSLLMVMSLLITAGLLRSFVTGANVYLSRMAAQTFFNLKRGQVINLALTKGHEISTAKTISVFSDEVTRAGQSIMNLSAILTQGVNASILVVLGLKIATIPMLIGMVTFLVLYYPVRLVTRKARSTGNDITRHWHITNDTLLSGIRNHFYLNIYGLIDEEKARAERALGAYLRHYREFILATAFKIGTPSFLGLLVISIVTYYSISIAGVAGTVLLPFFYLFLRMAQAIGEVISQTNDFRIHSASVLNIDKWFKEHLTGQQHQELRPRTSTDIATKVIDDVKIEISNVNFHYPGHPEKQIFDHFSLSLKMGDRLVVTGESGAGKSTLLSLMLGVLDPQSGSIRFNGLNIHESREQITQCVAYIGPTPYLIEGTIMENLLYGNPRSIDGISKNEIESVLKFSEIYDFIATLPRGLDTNLSEIGHNISTGQRQRISIARAMLRNPKFLIMDEATSNLDHTTEAKIISNLEKYIGDTVVVIVSHRPAFLRIANKHLHLGAVNNQEVSI